MNFVMKMVTILGVVWFYVFQVSFLSPVFSQAADELEHLNQSKEEPSITIILQRTYLDGEASEEIFTEKVTLLEEALQKYQDWQIVERDDTQLVLQKRINDISPLLKTSGYFGVSKEGILQIFKGMPDTDNVIQSFFQLDMRKLESYQREQLERGIRIQTKEQYVEVLETLKDYSIRKD